MQARLIDHEGVVWGELQLSRYQPEIRVPIPPKIISMAAEDDDPTVLEFLTVTFTYEQCADDGTLIYRRETPLWR